MFLIASFDDHHGLFEVPFQLWHQLLCGHVSNMHVGPFGILPCGVYDS